MKVWYELSKPQKVLLGVIFLVLVPLMPELAIIVDFGGLEMIIAFAALYIKPVQVWFVDKLARFKQGCQIAKHAIAQSAIAKPKVFVVSGVFCSVALGLTGSLIFSAAFILPGLVSNGLLI